jgi:hypothetical protein
MRSKAAHSGQYRQYDGGVGKGRGPLRREGLACLASARRRDRAGVFRAIVIYDIEVGGRILIAIHSFFDPIFGAGQ